MTIISGELHLQRWSSPKVGNVSASHHLVWRLWGACCTVAQSVPSETEPQLPSVISLINISFIDFSPSLFYCFTLWLLFWGLNSWIPKCTKSLSQGLLLGEPKLRQLILWMGNFSLWAWSSVYFWIFLGAVDCCLLIFPSFHREMYPYMIKG